MARVTGIGGIFFSARDPQALRDWYARHLGIELSPWGGAAFSSVDASGQPMGGSTIWSIQSAGDAGALPFAPSQSPFMVNYRVDDLAALLQALRDAGCDVLDQTEDGEFGQFGWVMDPEGHKIELWQPPAGR